MKNLTLGFSLFNRPMAIYKLNFIRQKYSATSPISSFLYLNKLTLKLPILT